VGTQELTLAEKVKAFPVCYHTLDLGEGVVTTGFFDHRPVLHKYPIPADLTGLRCLDVGTMDGFWAFEMERRGASEVVAIDLDDPEDLDWPVLVKPRVVKTLDETKRDRFAFVKSVLNSDVKRVVRSVYDLDSDLGTFDVVFMGDLLLHLKDPIAALEALLRVTRGQAIVCTSIMKTGSRRRRPLIEFDGIDSFTWWTPNSVALVRMMTAAGFKRVELAPTFELPLTSPSKWKGLRGVVTGSADGGDRSGVSG
jgi:tRNA (mo5U34)-methyltransferase